MDQPYSFRDLRLVIESAEAGAAAQLRIAIRTQGTCPSVAEQLRIVDASAEQVAAAAAGRVRLTPEDLRLVMGAAETANPAL